VCVCHAKTTTTNSKEVNLLNYSRYPSSCSSREKWPSIQHARAWNIVDAVPHRTEGEAVLFEHIPINAKRVYE
jgi:hypothetical protein